MIYFCMAQDQKTLRAGFMAFLGRQGEGVEFGKQIKSLALNALRNPEKAMSFISSTTDLIKRDQEIIDGWTPISEFRSHGGAFSGFDLRYWIELAKMAGVPFIPADPVLTLTDAEASILSGEFNIDQMIGPFEKHRQNLVNLINEQFPDLEAPEPNQILKSEKAALIERLFSAMDDLPANIMIRGVETGPSILKTLVGVGIIEGWPF